MPDQKTAYPTQMDGSKPKYVRDMREGAGNVPTPAFKGTIERVPPPPKGNRR